MQRYELTRESYILICTSAQDRNHVLCNVYESFILFSVNLIENTERLYEINSAVLPMCIASTVVREMCDFFLFIPKFSFQLLECTLISQFVFPFFTIQFHLIMTTARKKLYAGRRMAKSSHSRNLRLDNRYMAEKPH
jgi:hypothetical protein